MRELMVALVRSLIKNGVKAPADAISFVEDNGRFTGDVSTINLDFSEHDKMVAEEKDKRIEELERENNSLKERFSLLRTRCKPGIEKDFDKGFFGRLAIVGCNEEFTDIQNKRISELEDRHQSDCIRINQLLATIDVLTERYQKLREVHGL